MPKPGYLTPSTFADLMSRGKGKEEWGKTALKVVDNLALDLMQVERRDRDAPPPVSCQHGIEHEAEAIRAYEAQEFAEVRPAEFRVSTTHDYVGGTMDGLVGTHGGIEVKCPYNPLEHLANMESAKQFKSIYRYQLQGYFWIYELEWIDCISYDPSFPEEQRLYVCREYPNEEVIAALKARCEEAYRMAAEKAGRFGA